MLHISDFSKFYVTDSCHSNCYVYTNNVFSNPDQHTIYQCMIELRTYFQYLNADNIQCRKWMLTLKLLLNYEETNCFHMPVAYADEGTVMNHQTPTHCTFARFLWQHWTKTRVKRCLCLLACYIVCKAGASNRLVAGRWYESRLAGGRFNGKHWQVGASRPLLVLVTEASLATGNTGRGTCLLFCQIIARN